MRPQKDAYRWYALAFAAQAVPTIEIRIYESAAREVSRIAHGGCRTDLFFETDLEKGFGANRAIIFSRKEDGYIVLSARMDRKTGARLIIQDLVELLLLLNALPHVCKGMSYSDSSKMQLMQLLEMMSFGNVSPLFTGWMTEQKKRRPRMMPVREAIRHTWNALAVGELRAARTSFGGMGINFLHMERNGGFVLQTIGNACDVSTDEWWNRKEGEGHALVTHNLDAPIQLLSILAGYAKLYELAMKDLDTQPPS